MNKEIRKIIDENIEKINRLENSRDLFSKVLDVLNDRFLCRRLGIDYSNPRDEDYFKVAKYLGERK